jgi:hypothetical protein
MAHGDPLDVSPWVWEAGDYVGLVIRITVNFNVSTRALQSAVVHRDDGCQYHTIVLDNPSDAVKAKRLAAPADGAADNTYTAKQMSRQGLATIEDVLAVQITAEP